MLVTGGAGFIGSHVVEALLRDGGFRVTVLDKFTYAANPKNLSAFRGDPRMRVVRGDVADAPLVRRQLKRCRMVMNLAAETHVDRSIRDASGFYHTNIRGGQVLLEEARRARVRRFLQVSTDEVYGSLPHGKAREDWPLKPSSPYAASKAAADLLCLAYHRTFGLPVLVSRCTNNYGPHQHPEKVIPLFVRRAALRSFLPLYGSGRNVRDWIHVRDHAEALLLLLRRGRPGEVYNIAGETSISNRNLAGRILRVLGRPSRLMRRVPDRPGHDFRYAMDDRKIRALGWRPRVAFHEGLKKTIEWYRDHPDWWSRDEGYYHWSRGKTR